jgi:hypothetical protein
LVLPLVGAIDAMGLHRSYSCGNCGAAELPRMFAIRIIVGILMLVAAQLGFVLNSAADTITLEQRARLDAEIAQLPPDLRARFDEHYRDWVKTWDRPDILISSNSKAVRNSEEFRALVSLGPRILPRVVDKLLQPEEFFALQLYDVLQDRPELRDDGWDLGEQRRALATARRWLSR